MDYSSSTTASGGVFGWNAPAGYVNGYLAVNTGTNVVTGSGIVKAGSIADFEPTAGGTSSDGDDPMSVTYTVFVMPTANGVIQPRFRSEINGDTTTINRGFIAYQQGTF